MKLGKGNVLEKLDIIQFESCHGVYFPSVTMKSDIAVLKTIIIELTFAFCP
jgi:hypothetical protein